MKQRVRGFTLLELMIVVAVIAILAIIALGSYNKQIRKSRRAEAKQVLSDLALKEEKYRAFNSKYASIASVGGAFTSNYYTIAMTGGTGTATAYTFTAAPTTGTDQTKDTCGTLTLAMSAGTLDQQPATPGCWK